jgi:hypothetical protein
MFVQLLCGGLQLLTCKQQHVCLYRVWLSGIVSACNASPPVRTLKFQTNLELNFGGCSITATQRIFT